MVNLENQKVRKIDIGQLMLINVQIYQYLYSENSVASRLKAFPKDIQQDFLHTMFGGGYDDYVDIFGVNIENYLLKCKKTT